MKRICYQGIKGSFSYLAALNKYGLQNDYQDVPEFRHVFEFVENKKADLGVVPIENSLVGSIHDNYDLFNEYDLTIIGELYDKIDHCLFSVSKEENVSTEDTLKKMRKVLSHPKALEQCSHFFADHPWIEPVASLNTAVAAYKAAQLGDPTVGAIASLYAGEIYSLTLVQKSIQDNPRNYTRFVCIAKQPLLVTEKSKCSLLLKLKHKPQALSQILDEFGMNQLNLTKIESRPIHGRPFEYIFYLDFELNGCPLEKAERILNRIKNKTERLKCLGFYKMELSWKS